MRNTLLIVVTIAFYSAKAQEATIYKSGIATKIRVTAHSKTQLFTPSGNYEISAIDSIESSDPTLLSLVSNRSGKKTIYKSKNDIFIDDMPFDENGKLVYADVITESGSSQELYNRSKQFFVNTFKSANDVVQMDDKESYTIIGKAFSEIYIETGLASVESRLFYTIKIQSKDGRYRYEITDLYTKSYPSQYAASYESAVEEMFKKSEYYKRNGTAKTVHASIKDQVEKTVESLINKIKLNLKESSTKDSDW